MEQKTEASQAVDAPMPSGVENMTKQELWNWFQCYARAIAVKSAEEKRFFRLTTGLHDARMMTSPLEIIEAQRKRMAGLELQMAQMQKGYDKKLKKALKAQPAPTEATQPDRHALQAEGKHPAPCARHCEATAFGIEIRRLTAENAQLRAAQGEDSARLDAAQDVLAERRRQVEAECWTTEQDDEYRFGELAKAAICYVRGNRYVGTIDKPIDTWPFNHGWWKPTTDRRNLVKAGALIIAEIERIDRARASAETGGVKS